MEPNFSGYVTKADLKCADGRTIMKGAFAHQDGMTVPLVYMHKHDDINQVLGKVKLTKKEDGVWGDAFLNETTAGKNADILVKHGDIDKFSVWAKDLLEHGYMVQDGEIQEVSLVLAGKNPGARVENVLMHGGLGDNDDEVLFVGFEIKHADVEEKPKTDDAPKEDPEKKVEEPAKTDDAPEDSDKTVEEVLESLSPEQQAAVNTVIDGIVTEAVTEALAEEPEITHDNISNPEKGSKMSRNLFDRTKTDSQPTQELKHDDMAAVLAAAKGVPTSNLREFNESAAIGSLREFIRTDKGRELMHADTYGVRDIEVLFPDAQAIMSRPTFIDRRQEWVKTFMNGTSHTPFSRVKTFYADITADEARAKGYIKAHQKTDEVFPVFKRETGPTWVIKKQKLDRQDIIDVVDFDVVAWLKVEMRGKLDEEIARAALFGDGRPTMVGGEMNPDKIQDPGGANVSGNGIRAIVNDNDLYATTYDVPMAANATGAAWNALLDKTIEADEDYRGSGNKTGFISFRTAAKLLTIRDAFDKRIYRNLSEVAGDMGVNTLVKVPTELFPTDVLAVVLDLSDYNFGTNRGGEVTLFDDFDINFNQYHYLIETYLSGALVLPYAAQIFKRVDPTDTLVVPTEPAVVDNVITIPTQTGVDYFRMDTGAAVADGSTITLTEDVLPIIQIEARPADGTFYFGDNADLRDTWTFEYVAP